MNEESLPTEDRKHESEAPHALLTIESEEILRGHRQIGIRHNGETYRLIRLGTVD